MLIALVVLGCTGPPVGAAESGQGVPWSDLAGCVREDRVDGELRYRRSYNEHGLIETLEADRDGELVVISESDYSLDEVGRPHEQVTVVPDYRITSVERDYIEDGWLLAEFRGHTSWLDESQGLDQDNSIVYEHDEAGWDAVQDDGKTGRLDYGEGLRKGHAIWWDSDGELFTDASYVWVDGRLASVTYVDLGWDSASYTYEYDEGMPLRSTWVDRDEVTEHEWDCP
jgi:hypothetical protein